MSIRISSTQSQILVVDIQEKLAPHLHNVVAMVDCAVKVLKGAALFNIPISLAEQYPAGLGNTVPEIAPLAGSKAFEKTTFSCFGSPPLREHIANYKRNGKNTLIVLGCEAHVCVLQTVIDAIEQDYRVVVVGDAVSSRSTSDIDFARCRLSIAGAEYMSTEMLLFEWTQGKDAQQFKAISQLVKG